MTGGVHIYYILNYISFLLLQLQCFWISTMHWNIENDIALKIITELCSYSHHQMIQEKTINFCDRKTLMMNAWTTRVKMKWSEFKGLSGLLIFAACFLNCIWASLIAHHVSMGVFSTQTQLSK